MLNCFIGRRETGKTTLAMYGARAGAPRRLVFDPSDRIFSRAGLKAYDLDELTAAYAALDDGDTPEVIYTPRAEGIALGFHEFSDLVYLHTTAHRSRNLAVVIDESALVQDAIEDPESPMSKAMTWSERRRVHFFLTCHQPKDIPTRKRAITDYLVFFHTTQEHDLKVIRERCSEAFADRVSKLKPYRFLIWDDQRGAEKAARLEPRDWKIDLSPRDDAPPPAEKFSPPVIDRGALWRS
jgi:hypothetical protein